MLPSRLRVQLYLDRLACAVHLALEDAELGDLWRQANASIFLEIGARNLERSAGCPSLRRGWSRPLRDNFLSPATFEQRPANQTIFERNASRQCEATIGTLTASISG